MQFFETVYQEVLEREFVEQRIPFISQPVDEIRYKGRPLNKTYLTDFVYYDEVIVEIKSVSSLSGTKEAQLINCLEASKLTDGLLINFGNKPLEHKRLVYGF